MKFLHSEDTHALVDAASDFFSGRNPASRLSSEDSGLELWPELAEMGMLGAAVDSGLGLSLGDALLLSEEAGRACLPEPLSETMAVIVPLLESVGERDKAVQLINGTKRATICHELAGFAFKADSANAFLICNGDKVRWIERADVEMVAVRSIDPWRKLFSVSSAKAGELLATGDAAYELIDGVALNGAAAAAAELCGLTDAMIRMATEYAGTREQFGKPIGSFQAVKHLLANAQVKLEFARPVVYRAGAVLGTPQAKLAVAHAKVAATDAAMFAAEQSIQVFGGMGYTFEADLHYFMKRTWALAGEWGDREHHLQIIDDALLQAAHPVGPRASFS